MDNVPSNLPTGNQSVPPPPPPPSPAPTSTPPPPKPPTPPRTSSGVKKPFNSKAVIGIIVAVVVVVLGFFYFNSGKNLFGPTAPDITYEMKGNAQHVGTETLTVGGTVAVLDSADGRTTTRSITFVITPDTKITTKKIVITQENIDSGEEFTPEEVFVEGELSEIALGSSVRVLTKGDIFTDYRVDATEIIYISFDMPDVVLEVEQ